MARAVLEVKLVGEDWASSLVGPALIAIAAIVAAGVAAYTAGRNHRKQLEHDRELREREHTRSILDMAIEGVINVVDVFAAFSAQLGAKEKARKGFEAALQDDDAGSDAKSAARSSIEEIRGELDASRKSAHSKVMEMLAANARLKLRFGALEPLPMAHKDLCDSYRDFRKALALGVHGNRTEEQKEQATAAEDKCREDFATVMMLSEAWFTGK